MSEEIIKVCVRIPAHRKDELLAMADMWRNFSAQKEPGWDAKAIHEIAAKHYGGLKGLYEKHMWPERGSDMMRQVQRHVKETYGSVDEFVKAHSN